MGENTLLERKRERKKVEDLKRERERKWRTQRERERKKVEDLKRERERERERKWKQKDDGKHVSPPDARSSDLCRPH